MESASEMYLLLLGQQGSVSSCCRLGIAWLYFCPGRTFCLGLVWKLFRRKHFEERKKKPKIIGICGFRTIVRLDQNFLFFGG